MDLFSGCFIDIGEKEDICRENLSIERSFQANGYFFSEATYSIVVS
jgi:hypothetical protein